MTSEISRFDRICPVCDLNIEDEIHFLFDCPKQSSIRDDFFNKIDNRIPNYKNIPISNLIIQLMNSTDYYLKVIPQFCIAHPYCARFLRHQRVQMSARVLNVRDFPQTKLDSEINARFLLNEHGDPHFLFYKYNENNILNN